MHPTLVMLQHILSNKRQKWPYIISALASLLIGHTAFSQVSGEEKSFTAPRSVHEWVFLGNTETSKWEYDARAVVRSDSSHVRIRMKETPLKNSYCDVRGAKMWEQRSIQGYSDTLKLHPQFYYEGYERFGFAIFEETIDLNDRTYFVTFTADYDLGGLLLRLWDEGYNVIKPFADEGPESMLLTLFSKDISRRW